MGLDIDGPGLNLQEFIDLKLYAKSKVEEIEKMQKKILGQD